MGLANTVRFILRHPLGRERPLTALSRFARWQLSSRMGFGPTLVPFVGGSVLLVARGMTGATGNVYVGLHECDDMSFFLHLLRPADLFLDVGANIGSYTVLAAKAAGARCITLEPVPSTFDRLVDNLRVNRIESQVDARCVAAGKEKGEIRFSTGLDTMNHVVDETYTGAQQLVPVQPLDQLLEQRVPLAMKIDVEGFEREVLEGAPGLLANQQLKAILMEATNLHERYDREGRKSASAILLDSGFVPHTYDSRLRKLSPCGANHRSVHGNHLYLRDVSFISERLQTAPSYRVGPWRV